MSRKTMRASEGTAASKGVEDGLDDLQRQVIEAREEERRRIGQDLHDGLCQHLSAASLMAYSLQQSLASEAPRHARTAGEIASMLRSGAAQAREIAAGLLPLPATGPGLPAALAGLASTVRRSTSIACHFRGGRGAVVRDAAVASHLLRIAQEAVANAIKHSRARRISIALAARRGAVVLSVRDDGIGLPSSPGEGGGSGLHTMRYRAGMIDARLSLTSGKTGTLVTCSLPAQASPAAAVRAR